MATALVIVGVVYAVNIEEKGDKNNSDHSFIECLADSGVIIYGSSTCPTCTKLEREYDDYETIKFIYLDCSGRGTTEETVRCRSEMKTNVVPEVQIKGEVFDDWGSPENLSEETGCRL